MKLLQNAEILMLVTVMVWIVPMSYGHEHHAPMTGDESDPVPATDDVPDPPKSHGDGTGPPMSQGDEPNVPMLGNVPKPHNGGQGTGPLTSNGDGANVHVPGDVPKPHNDGHGTGPPTSQGDEANVPNVPKPHNDGQGTDPPTSNGDGANVHVPGDVPKPHNDGHGAGPPTSQGDETNVPVSSNVPKPHNGGQGTGPPKSNGDGANVHVPGDVPKPHNDGHGTGPPMSQGDEANVPVPGNVPKPHNDGQGTRLPTSNGDGTNVHVPGDVPKPHNDGQGTGPPTSNDDGANLHVPSDVPNPHNGGHGTANTPDSGWLDARATFYGDINGGETQQGACGYGDLHKQGYGLATAALSTALFNNGYTCGACYEMKCVNSPQWCLPGTIRITATNFCPPDYSKSRDCWCNPPQKHFDLSQPMFLKIAKYKAGVVPVRYRRVPCAKTGGIKFEIKGNPHFLMILPYNVGGAGDIKAMCVKGTRTEWITMSKNWGQIWTTGVVLTGQCLSFRITTSDGITKEFMDVTPPTWGCTGQSFIAKHNF